VVQYHDAVDTIFYNKIMILSFHTFVCFS